MAEKLRKQPGWMNKKDMAASCGLSESGFAKWNVPPVAKIGRETFYTIRAVVETRTRHKRKATGACEECGYHPDQAIEPRPDWIGFCPGCNHPVDGSEIFSMHFWEAS